ncbi:PAS domain-containing sensor histidine kinase [Hymenobacter rubidus]|uniref:PAS domain-containing sensor histidine kinase n=1 Tax=Hymenobacter rubidus TaxID=1441626 RepID=UPI00191E77FC|nr:PAS domain-containing protein [Hymenobacter rubidus]
MPASSIPVPPTNELNSIGLAEVLLNLSPSGMVLLRPLYADAGTEISDFAWVQLNAAAQQLLHLPAHPAGSVLTAFSTADAHDLVEFYRDAFRTGQVERHSRLYQPNGRGGFYQLAAQRHADLLVVSFADAGNQPPTAGEEALALERSKALHLAHAATEQEREQLYQLFEQTPVAIAIMRGPNLRVELANPAVCAIWGREPGQVLGRPYFEAVPDTAGQGFEQILADVLTTGQPFTVTEAPVTLARAHTGQPTQAYVNFVFQCLRDAAGEIVGLVASGTEVTEQVLARRQAQQLNDELTASNVALETRVQARTQEAQQARADAEAEHATLERVFEQAPMALAILTGPTHVITLANAEMGFIWGRSPASVLGRNHFEALPDLAGQGFEAIFADVYRTGKPYYLRELPVRVDRRGNGHPDLGYYHITYQPLHDGQGHITAITASAVDVTHQVLARQQVQQLNDELETRVTERTAEAHAALREAQNQREQLNEQQGLLHQILGQVPASVATLMGPEHRFVFFNDQYRALSAGRAELGLTVAEALPEVMEQGFVGILDNVYASGQPFIGKDMLVQLLDSATGQPKQRYVDFIYQPLHDSRGQIQGILAFILDTTESVLARRQAETLQAAALAAVQRRAQQRQELYQIFAQTPVAIVLLREPNHRIDYFNPAFVELFPPEEAASPLQGHTIAEVYPRIKMAGLVKLLDRVFETGESQVVIDMPLADLQPGSPRYVTLSYQAYREEGRIVGVAAFAYDVTEQVLARRQAETMQAALLAGAQRRAQQRQDLLSLFERAPVAVALLREPEHRIEYYNTSFERLYPGDDLQGRTVQEAYANLTTPDVTARLDRVYQTGETYQGSEQLLRTRLSGGPARYITFTYQAYREHDQIAGVAVFIHEVTEQVQARQQVEALNAELATTNDELNDSNTRLRRTNADLDTFVYSASHDLKSPITNIEGLLLALRQQLPAEALHAPLVQRLLQMMDGAVARFQQTLNHLTDVTRLQQDSLEQTAEAVDLPALVESVRLDILPELTAADATLTLQLHECPTVHFSPKNLRSILYNLLSNAIKYRDPARPAQIVLRGRAAAGQVVLEVQDNGLGLSEPQQTELFRLFRRMHTHVEGSGVGLYMVKKMVENAGGTLAVQSAPGVGSTFTVALPAPVFQLP